jgi:carbon monoxide dehydrogenase subunit G
MRKTLLLVIALITAGGPAFTAAPLVSSVDAGAKADAVVTVTEAAGVYSVTARFSVAEMPADVFAVLTDYEQIPRFMPGVRTSVVHSRENGRAVVEQEAISKMMMFSKKVHLILDVKEDPGMLTFRDRCGKSFASYEGMWRVTRDGSVTNVSYALAAQPTFEVPEFLLKRLLRRESGEMIEQLQREVTRRAHAIVPAP